MKFRKKARQQYPGYPAIEQKNPAGQFESFPLLPPIR